MVGPTPQTYSRAATADQVDAGLRSYMLRVYNYMSLGVAFTGAIAFLFASNYELMVAVNKLFFVFFIAIIGLGMLGPRLMLTKSVATAHIVFWSYAGLWGAAMAPMMYVYGQMDPMLIVRAFLISAGAFAGMSIMGYTTKKNLSAFGSFFVMASWGILLAILVNIFVQSDVFSIGISVVTVLIFSGITAWETQAIKNQYTANWSGDDASRNAIFGAFTLYGSFIVLFMHILRILSAFRSN